MSTLGRPLMVGCVVASALALSACSSDSASSTSEDVSVALTTGKETVQTTETLRFGGRSYSCPLSTSGRLDPLKVPMAEQQAAIRSARRQGRKLERQLKRMDKRYPGNTAPTQAIVDKYNARLRSLKKLDARGNRAVKEFNALAREYNSGLEDDCTRA